jgi:isopentenyldiphosphate isomerase
MAFLDHIKACNRHDMAKFRRLLVDGAAIGWVRHDVAGWLAGFSDTFQAEGDALKLHPGLDTPERRSQAVDAVCEELRTRHGTPALRGERYRVAHRFADTPLLSIDRAVVSLFGVRAYGVHVNGMVEGATELWIAKRASDKAVAPGKLDNLIAGGQPAHLSLMDNLIKEAAEEADIPEALARQARPVGAISYCHEDEWGLKPDVMACYDLVVPSHFTPRNTDGEIESFRRMAIDEVMARVRGSFDFKFNVNLVLLDFLIRHGHLDPDGEPDYLEIVRGLRKGTVGG